jgi:hypothetical protein
MIINRLRKSSKELCTDHVRKRRETENLAKFSYGVDGFDSDPCNSIFCKSVYAYDLRIICS